jgi:signal transduction histidine kinase
MFLYSKKLYDFAGFLTVASLDITIIIITYFEGLNAGGYLNFFPVVVASGFMANIHKVTFITIVTVALSVVSVLVSFFISSTGPINLPLTPTVATQLLFMNLVLNFGAVAWFSIVVILVQRKNNLKLIEARNVAELASKAKSDFLSVMSHELRTPLNGIIGITNILNSEEKLPQQEEYLSLLNGSGNQMLKMIDSLLQFNKLESSKVELNPTDFELTKLIKEVSRPFQFPMKSKGLDFFCKIEEKEIWLQGDDVKIIQVLNNLLANALKFTEKGSVTLSVNTEAIASGILLVHFSVNDTGIGIEKGKQELVFEDFRQASVDTTRRFGGSGLGLTISKKLVQLMGGELALKSELGKGSEFDFKLSLPLSGRGELPLHHIVLNPAKPNNRFTILVAEDNLVNAKVVSNFLEKWNLNFVIATNGQQAIDQMRIRRYDMVLMDLDMPEVDGLAATATLRSLNFNVPIIAFTAAVLERYEIKSLYDQGFTDCIEKPFKPTLLYEKLKRHSPLSIWE